MAFANRWKVVGQLHSDSLIFTHSLNADLLPNIIHHYTSELSTRSLGSAAGIVICFDDGIVSVCSGLDFSVIKHLLCIEYFGSRAKFGRLFRRSRVLWYMRGKSGSLQLHRWNKAKVKV